MKKYLLSLSFVLSCICCGAQTFVVDTLIYNGNPNNRINLLILGDGYTSAQMSQFRSNSLTVANYLLNTPPFNQYKSFFNVFAIEVISAQSGNDHPGISSDNACGSQPVTSVNNYLQSSFDGGSGGGGVHRCIYSNQTSLIYSIANTNFPQYDYVNVLANTTYYGGCAGGVTFTSIHASAAEIFVHEFGHSFGGLADEYSYGSTNCSAGTSQNINVTQQTDTSLLVWKKWLTTAPIPTTNGTNCSLIGLYKGANYCTDNWYRPKCNCKMNALNQPFCEICKEQFVYRISALVNNIEGYSPQNLSPVICRNTPQVFTANVLNSLNNTVRTQWFVDNVLTVNNNTSFTLNPSLYSNGMHTVKVVTYDTTATSRKTMVSHQVSWNVNIPAAMVINTTQTNATCNGDNNGKATAIATGGISPYTYSWSNGATGATTTQLSAGTYTVTVTSNGGTCSKTATITITQPDTLRVTVSANGPTSFCSGDSVKLTASPAHSYLWNNGATTQSIMVSNSGNYFVTIKDTSNCSAISTTTNVIVHPLPTASIATGGPTTFCNGDSVMLTASAANYYLWSDNDTTQNISVKNAGTYFVKVTDANGCSSTSPPITTIADNFPTAAVTANSPVTFCQGDSVILSASGNGSKLWSTGTASNNIVVRNSGNYSVFISNTCGTDTATISVTVHPLPNATISAGSATTFCQGDSVMLTASPANSYQWSNGASTQDINVAASGNYSVTVKDANGCTATSAATSVTVHTPQNNLAITVSNDTLTSPYDQSQWFFSGNTNSVGTGVSITCFQSGYYFVTGEDVNGCAAKSDSVFVNCSVTGIRNNISASGGIRLYPNPASGNVTIAYSLLKPSFVSIKIYDALGNLVQQILENEHSAGNHSDVIETTAITSGIYFIEVSIAGNRTSNKLVLIK
jgi:hypothetical protein